MVFFGKKAVQSRIDEAVKIVDKMTAGDFTTPIDTSGTDLVAPLMRALKDSLVTQEKRVSEGRRDAGTNAELRGILDMTTKYLECIAKGDIPPKIAEDYNGEHSALKNSMNATADLLREARRVSDENLRVKTALDNLTINVMIADNERNIVYMNKAVSEMLARAESDVRKVLPTFNVSRLLGSNIDQFHKNPAHQMSLLSSFTNTHNAQIQIGVRTFLLLANPIINGQGERLGSVVEWHDRSAEEEAEKEIKGLLEAANSGELSKRLLLEGMTGFTLSVGENINSLLDTITTPLSVATDAFKRIAKGDIPAKITGDYKGVFNDLVKSINATTGILKGFSDSVHYVSGEQDKGDIDVQIDTDRFEGDYKIMAQRVNEMINNRHAVSKEAMACVEAFGEGDFDAPLRTFPGKNVFINNTIEQVRANLKALMADASILSQAALDGHIQTRADVSQHQGDFSKIVEGMNATLEAIVEPITAIKMAANSISTAAKEIAAGNADLSHRTEQQAASLEETAASMEELASTVKQNSDNAKQANQMALAASDVALKGGSVVQQVVHTMSSINESARKIVDIISVIDGIALQTNILALNAAVEAARAGEQGRGFAVVASEVRNLAHRSAAAAKEIKGLIDDSVEKVEDGRRLVSEAGKTMDEIVVSVKRVTDIMADIAGASVEQSAGINQVNQAINQMDEVTQQNAALVEQAAAAAESLEEQAESLMLTAAHFRLDSDGRSPAPRRSASLPGAPRKPAARLASNPVKQHKREDDEWIEF